MNELKNKAPRINFHFSHQRNLSTMPPELTSLSSFFWLHRVGHKHVNARIYTTAGEFLYCTSHVVTSSKKHIGAFHQAWSTLHSIVILEKHQPSTNFCNSDNYNGIFMEENCSICKLMIAELNFGIELLNASWCCMHLIEEKKEPHRREHRKLKETPVHLQKLISIKIQNPPSSAAARPWNSKIITSFWIILQSMSNDKTVI